MNLSQQHAQAAAAIKREFPSAASMPKWVWLKLESHRLMADYLRERDRSDDFTTP